MKKITLIAIIGLFFASCSHGVYTHQSLTDNYNIRMTSKKEQALKQQIKIYLSEAEVGGDFEVISLNTYKPSPTIPIIRGYKKQMNKKFYQRMVQKAAKQNGDAVIVSGLGYYKVIKLK